MKAEKPSVAEISIYIKKGKKASFPSDIKPMLATLVDKSFDEPGWMYEIKRDGYRAIGYVNKDEAKIIKASLKS